MTRQLLKYNINMGRSYREWLVATPRLHECVSGIRRYGELGLRQTNAGIPIFLLQGIQLKPIEHVLITDIKL